MHPGQVRAVHATPACSRLQRDSQAPKKTYPHVASAGGNSNSGSRNKQTRHGTEGGNTHEGVCPQPASPFPQPASPCPALPQLQLLPQPNPVCTNGSNTESSTSDPGWCAFHTQSYNHAAARPQHATNALCAWLTHTAQQLSYAPTRLCSAVKTKSTNSPTNSSARQYPGQLVQVRPH